MTLHCKGRFWDTTRNDSDDQGVVELSQQAILKQFDPANVLVKFQGIVQAG